VLSSENGTVSARIDVVEGGRVTVNTTRVISSPEPTIAASGGSWLLTTREAIPGADPSPPSRHEARARQAAPNASRSWREMGMG
jgi:hypothetical protein